jgi:ABC-type multidrug transport system ATPase subunit
LGVLLATFHNPDLILLDEPTASLDPFSLRQIRGLLKAAANRGAAVLISTHALDEVHRVSDQIYIISKGKIVAHGAAQDIANQVGETVQLLLETHPPLNESDCAVIFRNLPEAIDTKLIDSRVMIQLSPKNNLDRNLRTKISQLLYENGYLVTYLSQELHQLESAFINLTEK